MLWRGPVISQKLNMYLCVVCEESAAQVSSCHDEPNGRVLREDGLEASVTR